MHSKISKATQTIHDKFTAIDLFCGCGGLSQGMKNAGFAIKTAIEIDDDAVLTYKMNHPRVGTIHKDIRNVDTEEVKAILENVPLHLLAGCPPCQGFSSVRRLNKKRSVRDDRNQLILEYVRFVHDLKPYTIMMENVPGIVNYYLFKKVITFLKDLGYNLDYNIVHIEEYGVPQRRRRFVLVGSLLGEIHIAEGNGRKMTVRKSIGKLEPVETSTDPVHKILSKRSERIMELISLVPKDGGSRSDLPEEYILDCHKKENVGFRDIYGRLRWDDYSSTITGGCLNPSKGRFLHPEEDRVITAREAALLQTFPKNYKFPVDRISRTSLAALIGNALPPKFSFIQCKNIKNHLEQNLSLGE